MFYAMTMQQKYYEENVSVFVAIAPCALIMNPSLAASLTAHNMYWVIETFTDLFNIYDI